MSEAAGGGGVGARVPGLSVHAVVGDFEHHPRHLPRGGRRLVAFLGGTIGNFKPEQRERFFREVAAGLKPGDGLLLGTALLKCRQRLFAACNDSAGVTAEFNRDEERGWIEMRLIALAILQTLSAAPSPSGRGPG